MRPFERITPGEAISATEYNRAMRELERSQRWTVAAPLMLQSDFSGNRLSVADKPFYWVKITGHKLSNYDSSTGSDEGDNLNRYSGTEQTDDDDTDTGSYDLPGGVEFFVDNLYLKEINGRTDVPEGAIVKAYYSDNGPYYTFQFEQAFDEYSGTHKFTGTKTIVVAFDSTNCVVTTNDFVFVDGDLVGVI